MQPSSGPEASNTLSMPVAEQQVSGATRLPGAQLAEMASSSGENQLRPGSPAPQFSVPLPAHINPLPLSNDSSTQDTSIVASTALPPDAGDVDLIEKEWVSKAKQIVMQTQGNPHQQSKDLTIFRADYMKKRYNKTIKLSE